MESEDTQLLHKSYALHDLVSYTYAFISINIRWTSHTTLWVIN